MPLWPVLEALGQSLPWGTGGRSVSFQASSTNPTPCCSEIEQVKGLSVSLSPKKVLIYQDASDWYRYRGTQTLMARGPQTGSIWKMDITLSKTGSIHVSQLIGRDIPKLSCRNDHTEKQTSTETLLLMAKY